MFSCICVWVHLCMDFACELPYEAMAINFTVPLLIPPDWRSRYASWWLYTTLRLQPGMEKHLGARSEKRKLVKIKPNTLTLQPPSGKIVPFTLHCSLYLLYECVMVCRTMCVSQFGVVDIFTVGSVHRVVFTFHGYLFSTSRKFIHTQLDMLLCVSITEMYMQHIVVATPKSQT